MKAIKTSWIIHIFAALHALVALSCRLTGVEDELLLTILTMSVALIICAKKGTSIEFSAASVIVANVIGYFLGNFLAKLLDLIIQSPYTVHALATALTTEILGWSIVALTKIFRPGGDSSRISLSSRHFKWLLLAMFVVFGFRLLIVILSSRGFFEQVNLFDATSFVFSDTVPIILLVCLNVLYIRLSPNFLKKHPSLVKGLTLGGFFLLTSLITSMLVKVSVPLEHEYDFTMLYMASLLAELTIFCIVYMFNYALTARSEMQAERGKANIAQYRYMKLKQQVNPHFLFNSLNILDCLVCDEKTEQASEYIHKLAGIYRYMIKSEEEDVVPLKDELLFVERYVDLLKVRFPDGFLVETDVPEEILAKFVLPCSIQLLIENATKHNAVNPEEPLVIRIVADKDSVSVSNNILPKVTKNPSTGLGLKYMKHQYLDLSGKDISIIQTEKEFCVTLPLL